MTMNKDLLWGAKPIAAELNVTVKIAYRLLEEGRIPATHMGDRWVTSRAALREYLAGKINAGFKIGEAK
jgi:excisionase family DNA binding protein